MGLEALDWSSQAEEEAPLSVSELVGYAAETLQENFPAVLILGELTSWSEPRSGHRYFTISDDKASIDCVMWRAQAARIAFRPEVGDEVLCRGAVGVYPRQGRMQLYANALKPVGAGAAQAAFERLKLKLSDEGLFADERKRPLPFLPSVIAVVTSRTGAALHDILRTIDLRFPRVRVVVASATVQGATAPRSICDALRLVREFGAADIVIVGRGGGASEDLAAFNDESVVRAVADFPVPTISAVGHEVDVSLCDLVADHRAATPTAAVEAALPAADALAAQVGELEGRLSGALRRELEKSREHLALLSRALRDPAERVVRSRQGIDQLGARLDRALAARGAVARSGLTQLRQRLLSAGRSHNQALRQQVGTLESGASRALRDRLVNASGMVAEMEAKLAALSPLAVLDRGYSLVAEKDGSLVRDSARLEVGQELELRFLRGRASARVIATDKDSS